MEKGPFLFGAGKLYGSRFLEMVDSLTETISAPLLPKHSTAEVKP